MNPNAGRCVEEDAEDDAVVAKGKGKAKAKAKAVAAGQGKIASFFGKK